MTDPRPEHTRKPDIMSEAPEEILAAYRVALAKVLVLYPAVADTVWAALARVEFHGDPAAYRAALYAATDPLLSAASAEARAAEACFENWRDAVRTKR
jgi:hypothetical protein